MPPSSTQNHQISQADACFSLSLSINAWKDPGFQEKFMGLGSIEGDVLDNLDVRNRAKRGRIPVHTLD